MLTSGASAATILFYGQSLPSLQNFKSKFQFQNTRIMDRNGKLLYDLALLSKSGGKRVVEPLVDPSHPETYYQGQHEDWLAAAGQPGIPVALQNATIATEDATFYSNPGFDPLSIARAAYENFTQGHVVSGASTITQQLIKSYMLSSAPTLSRKTEEMILAAELTQKYPKSKILWYYLNSVPYGNLSIGAEAAAKTYFNRDVWTLDLAQCAFLAGLPEAPSTYNPVNNLPAAKARMEHVLSLMFSHGYLKTNGVPVVQAIAGIMLETKSWHFKPPSTLRKFPQFVAYAIDQLQHIPALSGKVYSGLDVYTTLDSNLQTQAQQIVKKQIDGLQGYNVTDGALVSMDVRPQCYGCILSMVGSADYNNVAIAGQINMATSPRQPGSSFKPFNYVYAFEHGLSPATTVLDAPLAIPDTGNPQDGGWYEPTNYDHTYHGMVTLRVALQNSLNIPAVKVEQFSATTDPQRQGVRASVGQNAKDMGFTSLFSDNPDCCGWSLTLGGLTSGVRLVEETSAYGTFATGGMTVPPIAILKVYDRTTGKLLYDGPSANRAAAHRAVDAADAYVMTNVLSDNNSRCVPQVCEFGFDSPLTIPGRPIAAKTGTTNAFTDNWTVGYTPQIVTGVWVGNANNNPMAPGTTGVMGAAPIWHDFMVAAAATLRLPPVDFVQPPGVYFGSTCRLPSAYGFSESAFSYDIYAHIVPYCTVGTTDTNLPVPQTDTGQQPAYPPAVQPAAPVQPAATAVPAPIATQAPVATLAPAAPVATQVPAPPVQPIATAVVPPAAQPTAAGSVP